MAVLSLDLDQFKAVNDSLSHQAGICCCASLQSGCEALRAQDIVARTGSDDFVVVLPDNPGLLETEALLHCGATEAPYLIEGTQLVIS
jgi:diguanylate cyclase (GGDEF)-like protein